MKLWKFEFKFYKEIIKSFGFSLSSVLSFLLVAGILIIFPLIYLHSLLLMFMGTKFYLVFLALAISGMGYTVGNIALAMLFGESQDIPKRKLLAPMIVGIVFGITGAVVSFILVLIPPLAIYIILLIGAVGQK